MGQVFVLSNYVLKYSRGPEVKYISHLDFVRMFHRTVRRAGLDMEYSQGFNPHPIMTVAIPLSVGVTADGEYMKIGFKDGYTEQEIMTRINASLPGGYKITAIKKVTGKEIDFAKLDRAEYTVDMELVGDIDIDAFLSLQEIRVMKKSKSGVKETDIRPYIYKLEKIARESESARFIMVLAAGNTLTLKPETVIDAMKLNFPDAHIGFFTANRNRLLANDKELL